MTHTKQAKKCADSCPFIISELEIADFVALCLVLFVPVEFVDEVVDTL
jgi:hypothetical protein